MKDSARIKSILLGVLFTLLIAPVTQTQGETDEPPSVESVRRLLDIYRKVKTGHIVIRRVETTRFNSDGSAEGFSMDAEERIHFGPISSVHREMVFYHEPGKFEAGNIVPDASLASWIRGKWELLLLLGTSWQIRLTDSRPYVLGLMSLDAGCLWQPVVAASREKAKLTVTQEGPKSLPRKTWILIEPGDSSMDGPSTSYYLRLDRAGESYVISDLERVSSSQGYEVHHRYLLTDYRDIEGVPYPQRIVSELYACKELRRTRRYVYEVQSVQFDQALPSSFQISVPVGARVADWHALPGQLTKSKTVTEDGVERQQEGRIPGTFTWDPIRMAQRDLKELGF